MSYIKRESQIGTLLFCFLVIQPILIEVNKEVDSFIYMDDIYLVRERDEIKKVILSLEIKTGGV